MITSFGGIQQTMEVLNSSEFHLARSGSQILFYITSKALAYLTSYFREREGDVTSSKKNQQQVHRMH